MLISSPKPNVFFSRRVLTVGWKKLCTPGTGVNLWGESPLYLNPVNVEYIDTSTSRRQGRNREGPSEGKSRTARDRPKEAVGSHSLPGYGPVISVNRPVRTRMPGGVGAGGEKPPATRLDDVIF